MAMPNASGSFDGKSATLEPFESPIEEELCRVLSKHLAPDTKLTNQVSFATPNGNYRADFVLTSGSRIIVIEANGKEFHDVLTDIYRGAFILGFSAAQSVYYIRGCDIAYSLPTVLYAISRHEPYFFSDRGLKSLESLTEIKEGRGETEYQEVFCREIGLRGDTRQEDDHPIAYSLTVLRKDGDCHRWKRIFKAALENPGVSAKDFDSTFCGSPHHSMKKC